MRRAALRSRGVHGGRSGQGAARIVAAALVTAVASHRARADWACTQWGYASAVMADRITPDKVEYAAGRHAAAAAVSHFAP